MKNPFTSTFALWVIITGLTGCLLTSASGSSSIATNSAAPAQDKSNDKLTPRKFAFIELFTSEGCSSCPSADKNLERIAASAAAAGKEVYTLSYHVDYWNYLGWKDPYSDPSFSVRQRQYGRKFEADRVYTPQMIVNGKTEFVGSNQKLSDRAVKVALSEDTKSAVSVNAVVQADKINVNWKATGITAKDVVNVVLVQNAGQQKVGRGENARRNLTHVNIVRQFKTVEKPGAAGEVQLDAPKGFAPSEFHVVAFTQSGDAVTSAAKSKIIKSKKRSKVSKAGFPTSIQSQTQDAGRKLISEQRFLDLLSRNPQLINNTIAQASANWDISYVPMLLEVTRSMPETHRASVMHLLENKTGQSFGRDFDKWLQWSWKQEFKPHPGYGKFKSAIYQSIDPRFAEYFRETENATIRLDEVRWGGVRRDGIPPLKDPRMLAAKDAHYLADTDVVFGIELNGDARAYPKRILAWHEMFKDTIGG